MNDNNSSQDTEFDFNNPKESKKIVDPSMIRQGRIPVSNNLKAIGVGVLAAAFFFYYFFMGASAKKPIEDEDLKILKTLREEHSKSAVNSSHELLVQNEEHQLPQDSEKDTSSVADKTPPEISSSDVAGPLQTIPENQPSMTQTPQSSAIPSEKQSVLPEEKYPSTTSQPADQGAASSHNAIAPTMPESDSAVQEKQSAASEKDHQESAPVISQDALEKTQSSEKILPQQPAISSWDEQEWQKMKELMTASTDRSEKIQKELSDNFKRYATNTMQRLDQLSRDQVALSKIVNQLSQQLQQNADQLKQIERFVQADLKEFVDPYAGQNPIPKESQYAIHALIPGRAWLRDSQQKIISITEGQELQGYGKVLTIDPRLGTVIFSSGQVLRY